MVPLVATEKSPSDITGDVFFSVLHMYYFFVLIVLAVLTVQHKHPCPRRDSNLQSQQTIGRRLSP